MSLKELERRLSESCSGVYIVAGNAVPLREAAIDLLVSKGLERVGLPAFNHASFRASESNATDAFAAARTLPMMADLRLVVVRDLAEGRDDFFEALCTYIAEPSPSTLLVITGERFPKVEKGKRNWSARVKNALKKHGGTMLDMSAAKGQGLSFARDRAAAQGKRLERSEAELLIHIVGEDLGSIASEVDKLCLFVGDAERIDADSVEACCSSLAEAVVWSMVGAITRRDADVALSSLHRLQVAGDDPRKLLGMIVWQCRQILKMDELARAGAPDNAIRQGSRMRRDDFKALRPYLGRDFPSASDLLSRLARANRDMNSHRAGASLILEQLVLEMLRGEIGARVRPL